LKVDGKRQKNVFVDHEPAIIDPEKGFTTWDDCIERMFCELPSLQLLCKSCHDKITKEETGTRTLTRGRQKKYPLEYKCWQNMRSRCNNPRSTGYQYYGGSGITVCPEWNISIDAFVEDMGPRPSLNHSIERVDREGHYTKENCKWATDVEQARNTGRNCVITYGEESLCVAEWGERFDIKPNTITTRLRRGWTVEEALGLVKREKPMYVGRLTDAEIVYLVEEWGKGKTQTALGKELGIDSSNISRLLKKIKENK
jgi:hypothetical protein